MDKFDDKYRIESHRLHGYDYSRDGIYYITIVINGRECLLGEIRNGEMNFSEFGRLVKREWLKSFEIRKELFLDEYVIMPNHLHALVVISNETIINAKGHGQGVETQSPASLQNEMTINITHIQNNWQTNPILVEFKRKPRSLSSFIGGFKSASTNSIDDYIDIQELDIPKYNGDNKLWQSNYHDRIVRNEEEYWRIKNYIKLNPKNWESEDLYRRF